MALTEVVLVGTVKQADGDTAAVGSVTVVLNQMLFNSTEDIAIQPKAITQALDGSGHFAIPLVCTDDAATEPTGATYNLTFTFDDGGKDVFTIIVPSATGDGNNLDFLTVIQPGPPGTGTFYIPVSAEGIAGGVAQLDADAQVPMTQLHIQGEAGDVPGPLDVNGRLPGNQISAWTLARLLGQGVGPHSHPPASFWSQAKWRR